MGDEFDPSVKFTFRLPWVDEGGGDNWLGPDFDQHQIDDSDPVNGVDNRNGKGAVFYVDYTRTADSHANCTQGPVRQRYRMTIGGWIGGGGQASPEGIPAALVDVPVAGQQCSYVADWVNEFTYFRRVGQGEAAGEAVLGPYSVQSGDGHVFKNGDDPVEVTYAETPQFTPVIPIVVPADTRTDPTTSSTTSLYTDLQFILRVRPTADSPDGCSTALAQPANGAVEPGKVPLEFRFIVQATGDVEWRLGEPVLIDEPPGAQSGEACSYTVWYEPSVTSADGGTGDWTLVLEGDRTETVSAAMPAAPERMYVAATAPQTFTPQLSVGVPFVEARDASGPGEHRNKLGHATIYVDYAPTENSPMGCTDSDFDYLIVSNVGSPPRTDASPDTARDVRARLLSTPVGLTEPCRYVAMFSETVSASSESAGTVGPFPIVIGQDAVVSEGVEVRAEYADAMTFSPMLSFSVSPPAGGAASLYGGAVIRVEHTKTAGPSGCSPDDHLEYVVSDDGSMVTPRGGAPSLIDTVGDDPTACEYELAFPATLSSAPGETPWVLWLQEAATATVSASMATHPRSYAGAQTFTPVVQIGVPQINLTVGGAQQNLFADVRASGGGGHGPVTFRVAFNPTSGSLPACTAADAVYTVQTNGTVTGDAPALIDRLTPTGTQCVYDVMFPTTGLAGGMTKIADATDDNQIMGGTGMSRTARATYSHEALDGGVLDVSVTTPTHGTGTGRSVDVTVAGAGPGCLVQASGTGSFVTSATRTLTLASSGTTNDRGAFRYVDFPARSTSAADRCSYSVTWSPQDSVPVGSSMWHLHGGSTTFTATGRAESTGELSATYDVGLPALPPFTATLELRLSSDVAVGTTFSVGVEPVAGSHAGCVGAPAPVTLTAPAPNSDGSDTTVTATVAGLVDQPDGVTTPCVYDVAWPMNEDSGTAYIQDPAFDEDTTVRAGDATSRTATHRYIPDPASNTGGGTPAGTPPAASTPPPSRTGGGGGSGSSRRSSGGSGGGSRGGSSGGGGGGAATGPWVVSATSRVPVSVSLSMPQVDFPVGTAIEVLLNVPETCGADLNVFGGMPAEIGLVYAISAQSGATADVLAASALQLASHAERGDQTRGCELRVTLLTAPAGCTFTGASTDDAGRPYVDLTGDADLDGFALTPSLTCP